MSVPGEVSHRLMTPGDRERALKSIHIESKNPRNAAVMMLLYPKNNHMHLVLILRPTYEGVHSGQIALPGGKAELGDKDYLATALRETNEEVGVHTAGVRMLKKMTKVYIPPSNFWVHPYMGTIDHRPDFIAQEEEVEEIIEVPLTELLDEKNVNSKKLTTSYATNIEVPIFELNSYDVWGATAMMLSELKMLLKRAIV